MTPQNWNPGRGQTGGMLGFIIIQLNETRVVEFAKKNKAVWGSVCGSSVERGEGRGKHLTPQNWTLGRGQTGRMLGLGSFF